MNGQEQMNIDDESPEVINQRLWQYKLSLDAEKERLEQEKKNIMSMQAKEQALIWKMAFEELQNVRSDPANIPIPDDLQHRAVISRVSTIGNIKEFNPKDNWMLWIERLEQFFLANDISSVKKVPILLTLIGNESYGLLKNLCSPLKPCERSFQELVDIMKKHLHPTPSVITERYKFKECRQKESEGIREYLAQLKELSTFCNFGENLDNHLRDQFVWGIRSEAIKRKLLSEDNLTYTRAVEISTSMEAATKDVARMNDNNQRTEEEMNFIRRRQIGQRSD
ncbi:hypothetical protein QAD02_019368 [Eretmocerus hayati]|uniref:Uncharacterized protein n=1 Tax=Eretmocerus hayati TaxID=131215 RepID=A0ACC2PL85_9HYME|nr:hypothetical protein QAD02_019368 [Eretmocerus hayati]